LDNTSSEFIGDDSPEIASFGDHGRSGDSGLSLGLMGHSDLLSISPFDSPSLCFSHHLSFCLGWEKEEDKRKEEEENHKGAEDDSLSFLCCMFEQEGRTEELKGKRIKKRGEEGEP
jgi:hypothetical protein